MLEDVCDADASGRVIVQGSVPVDHVRNAVDSDSTGIAAGALASTSNYVSSAETITIAIPKKKEIVIEMFN
eukprot:981377-Amphidinium_carterae.1